MLIKNHETASDLNQEFSQTASYRPWRWIPASLTGMTVFSCFSGLASDGELLGYGWKYYKKGAFAPFLFILFHRLHAQAHPALAVDFQHFDANNITLGQLVADFFDMFVGYLRNVN